MLSSQCASSGGVSGGYIEWKHIRHGSKAYGPYPYLRFSTGGRQRSIFLKSVAQAARAMAASGSTAASSATG